MFDVESLVAALRYWQKHASALPVVADPTTAGDDLAGPTAASISSRYTAAAMAVTPSSQGSILPSLLAHIMLAAHHPVISSVRRHPQAAWATVKRKVHKLGVLFEGR